MADPVPAPKDAALQPLFEPLSLDDLETPHRVFMAPLTRNRAHPDGTPAELAIEYYRQRASAGLIITEATQITPMGKGYLNTPGLYDADHVAAWKRITDAVHAEGGRIAIQLWHVGRISHSSLLPEGAQPVAPSAIRAATQTFTENGFEDVSEPRALETDEIRALVKEYAAAARRSMDAGFDLVEIHAANGYLINQFLSDKTNTREDDYGGSAENRARFLLEVLGAVADEIGAGRTGVRLSPTGKFNDMGGAEVEETYGLVYKRLSEMGLAYLHVVEKFPGIEVADAEVRLLDRLRGLYKGAYIANGDFDAKQAAEWIDAGRADAVAFGRPFLANPDLPTRYALGAALNEPDGDTFYGGDHRGYTNYPFLEGAA
ncbi:MAG: alkene reductase [Pseudomonadota bacterium]